MVRWRSGVYYPRCVSWRVKEHGNYGPGLKHYFYKAAVGHSTTSQPVFTLVGRGRSEDDVPSGGVEAETALKIMGRSVSKGSTIHTDRFKACLSLSWARYGMRLSTTHLVSWFGVNAT